jgi:hypothetical protein
VIVGSFLVQEMGNSIPVNILIFDSVVVVFFSRSTLSKVKDQTSFHLAVVFGDNKVKYQKKNANGFNF